MKPSLVLKSQLTIHDLEVGKMVTGVIKSIQPDNKIVVVLSVAVQGII